MPTSSPVPGRATGSSLGPLHSLAADFSTAAGRSLCRAFCSASGRTLRPYFIGRRFTAFADFGDLLFAAEAVARLLMTHSRPHRL